MTKKAKTTQPRKELICEVRVRHFHGEWPKDFTPANDFNSAVEMANKMLEEDRTIAEISIFDQWTSGQSYVYPGPNKKINIEEDDD